MPKKPNLHAVEPEEGTLPPVEVGNPDAADEFAIDQSHLEEYTVEEDGPPEVSCAKPPKGVFFTTIKETTEKWMNRGTYFILELPNRDPYLVSPAIAKLKIDEDCIRPVLLVRYVTMDGVEGLWPLKIDMPDRKPNPWNVSAQKALKSADAGKWIRLRSGRGRYEHTISNKTFEEETPAFSSRTFKELRTAFFEGREVNSLDHEIWDELANGRSK